VRLITIYDNNLYDERLMSGWGFSCLMEAGDRRILFDTGGDPSILLDNMKVLGIDPASIDLVLLSHAHQDHTGGISAVIREGLSLYLPTSFPESFKGALRARGVEIIEVEKNCEISKDVYTTGELGSWIKEQSLVIAAEPGLVVITGCAHPGIVEILKYVRNEFDAKIYLVLGGFHLGERNVSRAFLELGVLKIAPSHCTGAMASAYLERAYRENFIMNGAGKVIEV